MDDPIRDEDQPRGLPEHIDADGGVPSKILVVDDSRVVRTYLQTFLQSEGFTVALARDGKEALDMLSDDIGMVLVDLWMPEMDGMSFLRHIKKNFPDIPAIMLTVSHEITHAVEAMKNGAFDYVTKPFNSGELLVLIQQAFKSRIQAYRLRQMESELARTREYENAVASKIQQTLLVGGHPKSIAGVKIGDLTVASKKIDGDFYDFFTVNDTTLDVIVGDVMGKGVPAALLGAAAKQRFMSVLYRLAGRADGGSPPSPEEIVRSVHAEMIGQMKDLETFFTLCYARFDLVKSLVSYVDCGHMRTIHYHADSSTCSLLQGVNMPLGFPGQDRFRQIQAPFSRGDLFFFYSDGLTEAKNPEQEFFGEQRLVDFIMRHYFIEPQEICRAAWKEIVEFSRSETISDDFTCVAVKIEDHEGAPLPAREWKLEIPSDLSELIRLRSFIHNLCVSLEAGPFDEEKIKMVQIVATEIVTNVIKHAYRDVEKKPILIEAKASPEELVIEFFDRGIAFDPEQAPEPVFDGSREDGFGLHIIRHTADLVRYTRDEDGRNCARVTFFIQNRRPG